MSEQKKPEIGEWWEHDSNRVLIVGKTRNGIAIAEYQDGSVYEIENGENFKHLPDCDSFDWQPETFPQYWTTVDNASDPGAYVIRTSKTEFKVIDKDGTTRRHSYSWFPKDSTDRTRLTQAEAEARVKNPEPVESPDDWVTQDRVPARVRTDQEHWSNWDADEWYRVRPDQISSRQKMLHGDVDALGYTLSLRCRRRDLPPLPQETPKREYVRLVAHRTSGLVFTSPQEALMYPDVYTELKHDGTGFYLEDSR